MNRKTVAVIGIGYVGLPLAAALANVGFQVAAVDSDKKKIQHLQNTYDPEIYEPGLSETLQRCRDNIEFVAADDFSATKYDVMVITVGTPLSPDQTPDFRNIDATLDNIGRQLTSKQVIILKSTVVPGTTRRAALRLEQISGLRAGVDFFIGFCPERTVEGLALHELYTIPKIVGGINNKSTEQIAIFIQKLGGKVIKASSPEVAELAKLSDNYYRSLNIALANELGNLCEKMGINASEVVSVTNEAYERTRLFKPGLGADGPCLGKDLYLMQYNIRKEKVETKLVDACIESNLKTTLKAAEIISNFIKQEKIERPRVALAGLAFKGYPETDDYRQSPAYKTYEFLNNKYDNIQFNFFDPIIKDFMGMPVSKELDKCLVNANVIVFLTNHPSLMNIQINDISTCTFRPLLIVDCWHNIVNPNMLIDNNIKIIRFGEGIIDKLLERP
jgi:UDP-N-acetyl-D-mannosaminuronic acid dehydrogenase